MGFQSLGLPANYIYRDILLCIWFLSLFIVGTARTFHTSSYHRQRMHADFWNATERRGCTPQPETLLLGCTKTDGGGSEPTEPNARNSMLCVRVITHVYKILSIIVIIIIMINIIIIIAIQTTSCGNTHQGFNSCRMLYTVYIYTFLTLTT